MSTIAAILLGIINIAIVVALLLLIGALIEWALRVIAKITLDENVRRLFLVIVALVAIYMFVALILGMPTIRIIGGVHAALSAA